MEFAFSSYSVSYGLSYGQVCVISEALPERKSPQKKVLVEQAGQTCDPDSIKGCEPEIALDSIPDNSQMNGLTTGSKWNVPEHARTS